MNKRRMLIVMGSAVILAPYRLFAQQPPTRVWRIGFLNVGFAPIAQANVKGLLAGLSDLGYVEGKNLLMEYRWAEGKPERLPALAAELVAAKVDLIYTSGGVPALAAGGATRTIPIVVGLSGDLVAIGLAASLAKPGGNVTGQNFFAEEIAAKGLELLKEAIPSLSRATLLGPPDNRASKLTYARIAAAATQLKVKVTHFPVKGVADFDGAFADMVRQGVGAVVMEDSALINFAGLGAADWALRHRLPSIGNVEFAAKGGMLGYGVRQSEMHRRAAVYVDKIFKGANPGELPIEQPTTFELIVNMKTANALRIKIPDSILVRATKVIE